MKRMILTSSSGVGLTYADRADMVVPLIFRFVSGPLPTSHHLDEFLDGRLNPGIPEVIWADLVSRSPQTGLAHKNVALVRFCEIYGVELIELWFDPSPNNQLQLIWILDYLRAEPYMAERLKLRLVDFDLLGADVAGLREPAVADGFWQSGACGPGQFPQPQSDPALVGRHASDQRTALALESAKPFAGGALNPDCRVG